MARGDRGRSRGPRGMQQPQSGTVAARTRLDPHDTHVRTSIIVPLHGKLELTRACLRSLHEAGLPPGAETMLVDNCSPDGTREWLAQLGPEQARTLLLDHNSNFAGACNAGARAAHGDVLVFLNNDTEVTSGWLEPLVRRALTPGIGLVGARLLYPDRTVQHAGVWFDEHAIGHHAGVGRAGDDEAVLRPREVQAVTAACVAVRRSLWDTLGGFDEGYRNGLEDIALCLAARCAGHVCWYEPAAVVVHHESQTPGRFAHARHNIERYRMRWGHVAVPDRLAMDGHGPPPLLQVSPASVLVDQTDVVVVPSGDALRVGAAVNAALAATLGSRIALVLPVPRAATHGDPDPAAVSHLVDAWSDDAWRECVTIEAIASHMVVGVSRAAIDAAGGLDLRLVDGQHQLCDWLNRLRLHGWRVLDTRGALGEPGPWHVPGPDVEREALFDRRWRTVLGEIADRETGRPAALLDGPVAAGSADLASRARSVLVTAGPDAAAFRRVVDELLSCVDSRDELTIVVRIDPGDEAARGALHDAADGSTRAAEHGLADIVLVAQEHSADPALSLAVDAVVCGAADAARSRSLARYAACAAVTPGDVRTIIAAGSPASR